MVADGGETATRLLARLLGPEGYVVHAVSNGESALAAVERHDPDLVLLDSHLPGLDGFEVCRRIKQRKATRDVPVVLVTGVHAREHRLEGIEAGADDFLSKPFDVEELRTRISSLLRLRRYAMELEAAEAVIVDLALRIEARDGHTEGHCRRLALYATALGEQLELPDDDLAALHRGGYLHDIGKIALPDELLRKPAPLSSAERDLVRQHPIVGERLCGRVESLTRVRSIVRHHHERLDGSGYPDGLKGDDVPLLAQIVGIADAYDAITTLRPYRPARPPAQAYAELKDEATAGARRKDLVDTFIALGLGGRLAITAPPGPTAIRRGGSG